MNMIYKDYLYLNNLNIWRTRPVPPYDHELSLVDHLRWVLGPVAKADRNMNNPMEWAMISPDTNKAAHQRGMQAIEDFFDNDTASVSVQVTGRSQHVPKPHETSPVLDDLDLLAGGEPTFYGLDTAAANPLAFDSVQVPHATPSYDPNWSPPATLRTHTQSMSWYDQWTPPMPSEQPQLTTQGLANMHTLPTYRARYSSQPYEVLPPRDSFRRPLIPQPPLKEAQPFEGLTEAANQQLEEETELANLGRELDILASIAPPQHGISTNAARQETTTTTVQPANLLSDLLASLRHRLSENDMAWIQTALAVHSEAPSQKLQRNPPSTTVDYARLHTCIRLLELTSRVREFARRLFTDKVASGIMAHAGAIPEQLARERMEDNYMAGVDAQESATHTINKPDHDRHNDNSQHVVEHNDHSQDVVEHNGNSQDVVEHNGNSRHVVEHNDNSQSVVKRQRTPAKGLGRLEMQRLARFDPASSFDRSIMHVDKEAPRKTRAQLAAEKAAAERAALMERHNAHRRAADTEIEELQATPAKKKKKSAKK